MYSLTAPLRIVRRAILAARYRLQLNYSWHLAWVKAAR